MIQTLPSEAIQVRGAVGAQDVPNATPAVYLLLHTCKAFGRHGRGSGAVTLVLIKGVLFD